MDDLDAADLDSLLQETPQEQMWLLGIESGSSLREMLIFQLFRADGPVPVEVCEGMLESDGFCGAALEDLLSRAFVSGVISRTAVEPAQFQLVCPGHEHLSVIYYGDDAITDKLAEFFNKGLIRFAGARNDGDERPAAAVAVAAEHTERALSNQPSSPRRSPLSSASSICSPALSDDSSDGSIAGTSAGCEQGSPSLEEARPEINLPQQGCVRTRATSRQANKGWNACTHET